MTRVRPRGPGRWLVALACAVAVLDSIFIAALAPLLPYYTERLGIGSAEAGTLSASYGLGLLLGALPAGIVASRTGVRRTLAFALAALALSSVAFGLGRSFGVLVAARTIEGAASALAWTAMLAWLVAASPVARRGRLLGVVFAAAFVGFTLGPVLGALAVGVGPGPAFVGVGAVAAALALSALALDAPRASRVPQLASYAALARRRGVPYALLLQALPGLLFGATAVVVSLRLADLGATATAIALAFVVAGAVQGVGSILAGRWTDHVGPLLPIRAGLLLAAAATPAIALVGSTAAVAALLGASWLALVAVLVSGTALLAAEVERAGEEQSLGFALMNLAFAPGALVGAIAAGFLRDGLGDSAALVLVGMLCLATLLAPPPDGAREPAPAQET